jgi:hypothetical protein
VTISAFTISSPWELAVALTLAVEAGLWTEDLDVCGSGLAVWRTRVLLERRYCDWVGLRILTGLPTAKKRSLGLFNGTGKTIAAFSPPILVIDRQR